MTLAIKRIEGVRQIFMYMIFHKIKLIIPSEISLPRNTHVSLETGIGGRPPNGITNVCP
jgi:hypothetical protein